MEKKTDQLIDFILSSNIESSEEDFFKILCSNDNLCHLKIQSLLMNNWWELKSSLIINDYYRKTDKNDLFKYFYQQLNWDTTFFLEFQEKTMYQKNYMGQNISWFHFGLLNHWTFLHVGLDKIPNLKKAINQKTSRGDNTWHVWANSFQQHPRYYEEAIEMGKNIAQFCSSSVMEKNEQGQTVFDILQDNQKYYESNLINRVKNSLKDSHDHVIDFLNNLVLKENLDGGLPRKKQLMKNKI